MAERVNGKGPFTRRTHGSERRGVFPVPQLGYVDRQEQSKRDKSRLIDLMRQRNDERHALLEQSDLGNKALPAYQHKQEILTNIEAYKAVILGGETGSGKSTQLPQYLYEAGYDLTVVMVPRRVIADGLGERIREEMAEQIELFQPFEMVGIVHGERVERHDNNKIIVVTPATFNLMEPDLRRRYGDKKVAIIADEIHESNLFTEIATGIAATTVRDLNNWRLIAASATHNAGPLQASFQALNLEGYVPEIHIKGRPYNVEMRSAPVKTPMEVYVDQYIEHEKTMIFTSGKREIDHIIEETALALEADQAGSSKTIVFRKLHGDLTEYELSHINDPLPEGHHLVIVSSPAGMSGITIPGVTLVITDGTINRQELDDDGVPGLTRHYLSKAEIIQQIGRAGRDVDGGIGIIAKPTTIIDDILRSRGKMVAVPQMEFVPFEERIEHAPPEIYSSNLSSVVLAVSAVNKRFSDINQYIPHPVKASAIIAAEESLYRLGALDDADKITTTGAAMNGLPVSPELSRGIYEVVRHDRSALQLARAAFIAASVDVGGLQDFSDSRVSEWRKLIRPTTSDDFMAQLDMMLAVNDYEKTEQPLYQFAHDFTLHQKRIDQAKKVAAKIMNRYGMHLDNFIVTAPLPDEEAKLRHYFTAGMIDQVHQASGSSYKKTLYRNIHGNDESTQRSISDRSVSQPKADQLVAGFSRWFTKRNKQNETIRHDVLEMTLHVDPVVVGTYALASKLLVGRLVSPRIEGDRIVEREQMTFGTIDVGEPVTTVWREQIPSSSQQLLVEQSLRAPGEAQKALRDIADEIELYKQRIPADILKEFMAAHAPADMTKQRIQELIVSYARFTRSLSEIDHKLAQYVYSKNISINRYFDNDARIELRRRSPDTIKVAGSTIRLLYDEGQPYITTAHISLERFTSTNGLFLEDGREVLVQIAKPGGGTMRVPAGQL